MVTVDIPRPDDWHVHLRDDDMLRAVVDYTARRFRYAMVMPNLVPPVCSTAAAAAYRDRILAAASEPGRDFRPQMALYCSPAIDLDDLRAGVAEGVVAAVKYYPAGATTNSAAGGTAMADFDDLFGAMTELDIRLLVHAESTDPAIDIFDREAAFLDAELAGVCDRHPELDITLEHVSTRAGLDFVAAHPRVAATITPHHLSRDRSDLLASGMKPDLYCKPVINSSQDREALATAATAGTPGVFLGTDSAPHPTTAKYGPTAKAGVFNAAYGLEVVAETFHRAGALHNLAAFTSLNGAAANGVAPSEDRIRLTRSEEEIATAAELTTSAGDRVVLFGAEEAAIWTIEDLTDPSA